MIQKGMKGKMEFKEPISTFLSNNVIYEITSITPIQEMLSNGLDMSVIYTTYGISDTYKDDVKSNVDIIGFIIEGSTEYIYVPKHYITKAPVINGVEYVEKLLVINIGLVPVNLSLDIIKDTLRETLESEINIEVIGIKDVSNSGVILFDDVEHNEYMFKTNNFLENKKTYKELYQDSLLTIDKLIKNQELINLGVKLTNKK